MTGSLFSVALFFSSIACLSLIGCKEEAGWKNKNYAERTSNSITGAVKVPKELWERLIDPEKPLRGTIELSQVPTPNQGGGDSAIAKATIETDLKPLTVYMVEESRGVLGGRNSKIIFGPGGGDLDLRDFIAENRGAFRIIFEFGADLDPAIKKRVWYLSNAVKRKVGTDSVGAGCDTYMDISSFVAQSNLKDGILIAVSGDRYVSALAGTFFFSAKRGGRVQTSRLTLFDSSKRKLQCRGRGDS